MYDATGRAYQVPGALQKLLAANFSEQADSLIHDLSRNARASVVIKGRDERGVFIDAFKNKRYHPWKAKKIKASKVLIFLHIMDD